MTSSSFIINIIELKQLFCSFLSMFGRIFFSFFLFTLRFSTEGHFFSGFLTVFHKVSRFWQFFWRFQSVFGVLSFFLCFLNVFPNFLFVFLVFSPILYRRIPFVWFLAIFRKVSHFWSFFRRFQSVFGVISFFLCFLKVFSNFLFVFLVDSPILYRRTLFFWFFNGFSQSQPFFRRFQSAFGVLSFFCLLSQRFFEFSFGFSCFLSDSLPKDTFFLVF